MSLPAQAEPKLCKPTKKQDQKQDVTKLWERFLESQTQLVTLQQLSKAYCPQIHKHLRDRLFEQYRHLADMQAHRYFRLSMPYRSLLSRSDLFAYAHLGLLEAIDSFSPAGGASFETHAFRRVRGAIIDGLRSLNDFPRIVSRIRRELEPLLQSLAQELLRAPTIEELAAKHPHVMIANMTLEEISKDSLVGASIFNQDNADQDHDGGNEAVYSGSLMERQLLKHHTRQEQPHDRTQRIDMIEKILLLLKDDSQEQSIFYLYYFLGDTSTKIAKDLGLSPTWVSIKRNSALTKLRKQTRQDADFADELHEFH